MANAAPKPSRPPSGAKHKPHFSTFACSERTFSSGEEALVAGVFCLTADGSFSRRCHFPTVVAMFRFASLPLGFPYLFAAVDLFSTSRFFWGGLALVLFALARLVSSSRFFFFALFGRRQSLVLCPAKNGLFVLSLACARHAPARSVSRIIAFTSSPNARNSLIWSVLR